MRISALENVTCFKWHTSYFSSSLNYIILILIIIDNLCRADMFQKDSVQTPENPQKINSDRGLWLSDQIRRARFTADGNCVTLNSRRCAGPFSKK